jgi:RNA polymerase subunit RPABC4/transcription elongation factor Spt4
MQIKMATAKHERQMAERRQEIDADFTKKQFESEAQLQQIRIKLDESKTRMGTMERLLSQGIVAGAVTPEVLKTFLVQSTEQEYATTSDDKVKSRSQAQAARNNLDTYKDAEGGERKHQVDMTGQAANMMQSAQPNVPETLVQGGGITPNVHMSIPAGQSGEKQESSMKCRKCNKSLQAGWKHCPSCGEALANGLAKCACGAVLEAEWKACPYCGKPTS